ncbi:hypothetical protein ACFYM0_14690 [Streptomyces sp. NPDC006487]|uniref:hypothetical protein n=1 Tax=Streptomyces sp. NPDC006487 TaxID=3364748 RepID=UPI0036943326
MSDDLDWLTRTPEQATEAAFRFYEQHTRDMQHVASGAVIFREYERVLRGLAAAFSEIAPNGDTEILFPEFHAARRRIEKNLNELTPVSAGVGLTRCVENFLSYVSDVITDALISQPDLLRSQEQVTLEEVLQHDSIEDFVSWAAEKRVAQLSFKGLNEIAQYISKRLGLELHQGEVEWLELKKGVAIRNLIVHRRGRVDQRFIHSTGEQGLIKGSVYEVAMRDYVRTAASAMKIVGEFDAKVAQKFPLTRRSTTGESWYSQGRWGPEGREGGKGISPESVEGATE